MQKVEFGWIMEGGKLVLNNRQAFTERVARTFKDGARGVMVLEELQPSKSSWQLRYYHGPVMDMVLKYMLDAGYEVTKTQARGYVEALNPYLKQAIQHNSGEVAEVRISLSDCSREQMSEVIDWTIRLLAEADYIVESAEEWRQNMGIK